MAGNKLNWTLLMTQIINLSWSNPTLFSDVQFFLSLFFFVVYNAEWWTFFWRGTLLCGVNNLNSIIAPQGLMLLTIMCRRSTVPFSIIYVKLKRDAFKRSTSKFLCEYLWDEPTYGILWGCRIQRATLVRGIERNQ